MTSLSRCVSDIHWRFSRWPCTTCFARGRTQTVCVSRTTDCGTLCWRWWCRKSRGWTRTLCWVWTGRYCGTGSHGAPSRQHRDARGWISCPVLNACILSKSSKKVLVIYGNNNERWHSCNHWVTRYHGRKPNFVYQSMIFKFAVCARHILDLLKKILKIIKSLVYRSNL